MEQQDVYRELSKKLMMENSTILPKIWQMVCSDEEAQLVNRLPATMEQLVQESGKAVSEMQDTIHELFHRGVVFESVKEGVTLYRMPRHILQFHDATILWPEASEEFFKLWEEFEETDYPELLELVTAIKLPSFMRVIPIGETINVKNQVLAFEDARKMLETADSIAVTTCVCRKLMKRCDGPLEVCLQLNRGAEYTIKRGTGRKVSVNEAIAILKISEAAGLVHLTENTTGKSNVLCNCCNCCCEMLRFATNEKTKGVLAPSRFQAKVEVEACTSCGMCMEICPVEAIALNTDEIAEVNADACIGCGLCAATCPVEAISLFEVRPKEFIPGK
jgi:Pyruvate/2-oxoacid:ferredoxin oxidoreductase delta subunit